MTKRTDRKQLGKIDGQRKTFRATVERFGTKPAWNSPEPDPTILLKNVLDVETDQVVTDHLWFNLTKGFAACDLHPGDTVQFDARVKGYTKGYQGRREIAQLHNPPRQSHKLSHPTNIKKVTE